MVTSYYRTHMFRSLLYPRLSGEVDRTHTDSPQHGHQFRAKGITRGEILSTEYDELQTIDLNLTNQ